MQHKLNIVSFDIPYPADYGGVIDVFYKLKSLKKLGVGIYFHCFEYGNRKQAKELNDLCENVFYYKRKKYSALVQYINLPYIVASRNDDRLLNNLSSNNYPILFEGLHTCFFIGNEVLKNRLKFVRMHNIESDYYKALASSESKFWKQIFFNSESRKLEKYEEEALNHASGIFTISSEDQMYFNKKYNIPNHLLNVFHENEEVSCKAGKGDYHLFHGNLSVNENEKIVEYLVNDIYKGEASLFPLKIAGKDPSPKIRSMINDYENIELISNPDQLKMNDLISEAHINLLPTFQKSGVKLKLVNALYKGRFCLVNENMLHGLELEQTCTIANNKRDFIDCIKQLQTISFSKEKIQVRSEILSKTFNNIKNAEQIINIIL